MRLGTALLFATSASDTVECQSQRFNKARVALAELAQAQPKPSAPRALLGLRDYPFGNFDLGRTGKPDHSCFLVIGLARLRRNSAPQAGTSSLSLTCLTGHGLSWIGESLSGLELAKRTTGDVRERFCGSEQARTLAPGSPEIQVPAKP